jgi:hypothetical protein
VDNAMRGEKTPMNTGENERRACAARSADARIREAAEEDLEGVEMGAAEKRARRRERHL